MKIINKNGNTYTVIETHINKALLKDNYGDCVIRALTKVMNKTWLEVFDDIIPMIKAFDEIFSDFGCIFAE